MSEKRQSSEHSCFRVFSRHLLQPLDNNQICTRTALHALLDFFVRLQHSLALLGTKKSVKNVASLREQQHRDSSRLRRSKIAGTDPFPGKQFRENRNRFQLITAW